MTKYRDNALFFFLSRDLEKLEYTFKVTKRVKFCNVNGYIFLLMMVHFYDQPKTEFRPDMKTKAFV